MVELTEEYAILLQTKLKNWKKEKNKWVEIPTGTEIAAQSIKKLFELIF